MPEYERPEYREALARRDDEEFRRKVRERAEEQRRRAREAEGRRSADDPD